MITNEQLTKKFESLPENIQEAILSADVDKKVAEVGKKHGLHIDQMGLLSWEANLVMFGFTGPQEFAGKLEEVLKIDREKAGAIVENLNKEVFSAIRESLKKVPLGEKKEEETPKEEELTTEDIRRGEDILKSVRIKTVPESEVREIPEEKEVLEKAGIVLEPSVAPAAAPAAAGALAGKEAIEEVTEIGGKEEEVLKTAGVELSRAQPTTDNLQPTTEELDREELLGKVEKPSEIITKAQKQESTKVQVKGIVEEKLGKAFKIPEEEKDYPLAKPEEATPPKKEIDPYREKID